MPPLFNILEVLFSASDTAKLFSKNFLKNFNLDESCISLPVFISRTNLKHHKVSVTPKIIKRVIKNLIHRRKCPDCVPVAVLKNCESEL